MHKNFEKIRKRMSHIEDKMMFIFSVFEKEDETEILKNVEELAVLMSAIYIDNKK